MVVAQLLGACEGPGFYTRHVESLCQPFVPYAVTNTQQTFLKMCSRDMRTATDN